MSGFGPLPVNELEEIEADPDAVDPDQIRYVLDVIAVDKFGNRDTLARGRNRVVFFVR